MTESARSLEGAIGAIAVLDDPVRKNLYGVVRRAGRPMTREEAAAAAGISRNLAAFHLDKLVAAGLLRSGFDAGDRPRQVGRTPKTYVPSAEAVQVSVPARAYQDLAEILLDAVTAESTGTAGEAARREAARERGRDAGRSAVRPRGRLGPERALTAVEAALDERGYEPYRPEPDCVRMRNCPFHPLAARSPEVVCGINVEFCSGLLEGMDAGAVRAVLAPREGECCVEIRRRDGEPSGH